MTARPVMVPTLSRKSVQARVECIAKHVFSTRNCHKHGSNTQHVSILFFFEKRGYRSSLPSRCTLHFFPCACMNKSVYQEKNAATFAREHAHSMGVQEHLLCTASIAIGELTLKSADVTGIGCAWFRHMIWRSLHGHMILHMALPKHLRMLKYIHYIFKK